jgi:hypothetical protein
MPNFCAVAAAVCRLSGAAANPSLAKREKDAKQSACIAICRLDKAQSARQHLDRLAKIMLR